MAECPWCMTCGYHPKQLHDIRLAENGIDVGACLQPPKADGVTRRRPDIGCRTVVTPGYGYREGEQYGI